MGVNSCKKGKRGEREAAKYLTELGFPARRGQQHDGTEGKDVVFLNGAKLHLEIKYGYDKTKFDIGLKLWEDAIGQMLRDSGKDPCAMLWRQKYSPVWKLTYSSDEWPPMWVTIAGDSDIQFRLHQLTKGP